VLVRFNRTKKYENTWFSSIFVSNKKSARRRTRSGGPRPCDDRSARRDSKIGAFRKHW